MVVLLTVGAHAAVAMNVRRSRTLLARSPDGAALYEVREAGPEGGGSLAYRIEGRAPGDAADFLVSSNFSPGNGSRPQTVSVKVCEQRLDALGAELARRKIPRVTVHPERCRAVSRGGLVTSTNPDAGAAEP